MRLFLLWFQALRENAGDEQIEIFKSLIPGLLFSDSQAFKGDDVKVKESRRASVGGGKLYYCMMYCLFMLEYISALIECAIVTLDWVQGDDVIPLLITGEKPPENMSKYYLDHMLYHMANQVRTESTNS